MKQHYKFLIHNWVSGEDITFVALADSKEQAWEMAEAEAISLEPSNCMRNVQVMGLIK